MTPANKGVSAILQGNVYVVHPGGSNVDCTLTRRFPEPNPCAPQLSGHRCGVDVSEADVADGAKVERTDFPWEVNVFLRKTSNRPFERLWSGVLVKPNLVITGA